MKTLLRIMILEIINNRMTNYLSIEPKPPFPPERDALARMKASVSVGHGCWLPGRISSHPLYNLKGTFREQMPSSLVNSSVMYSYERMDCLFNWIQTEEIGLCTKISATIFFLFRNKCESLKESCAQSRKFQLLWRNTDGVAGNVRGRELAKRKE